LRSEWNLYWVESDGLEDCFIVAKNSRSARSVDMHMCGFPFSMTKATKICNVPREIEQGQIERERKEHPEYAGRHPWPWYAYEEVLTELGLEKREIGQEIQMRIGDFQVTEDENGGKSAHYIGMTAMQQLNRQVKDWDYEADHWSSRQIVLLGMLGEAIFICHEIEDYISKAFILCMDEKEKSKYDLISDLTEAWKRLTFGELFKRIRKAYTIDPMIEASLELFLAMRNRIVHGISSEPKYNIHDLWGQDSLLSFLNLFIVNARVVRKLFRDCVIASNMLGEYIFGGKKDSEYDDIQMEAFSTFASFFSSKSEKGEPNI